MPDGGRLQRVRKSSRLNHHSKDGPEGDQEGDATQPASSVLDSDDRAPKDGGRKRPSNLVLGVSLPQWRHTPWAEPLILVQRYEPTATSMADHARLEEIDTERGLARADWDSSGAPDPAVALVIAEKALAGQLSPIDAAMIEAEHEAASDPIAGGGADRYRVHTCGPTVPAAPVPAGAWSEVAASREDDLPQAKPGRASKLPPPDLEDDLIPFDPPPSAFVLAMRAMVKRQARTCLDAAAAA